MLNIIILAAGLGKRMQSDLPKVLHPIAGKPMLAHVLDSARALSPDRIVVVTGHGAERVQAAFAGQDLSFAQQRFAFMGAAQLPLAGADAGRAQQRQQDQGQDGLRAGCGLRRGHTMLTSWCCGECP